MIKRSYYRRPYGKTTVAFQNIKSTDNNLGWGWRYQHEIRYVFTYFVGVIMEMRSLMGSRTADVAEGREDTLGSRLEGNLVRNLVRGTFQDGNVLAT